MGIVLSTFRSWGQVHSKYFVNTIGLPALLLDDWVANRDLATDEDTLQRLCDSPPSPTAASVQLLHDAREAIEDLPLKGAHLSLEDPLTAPSLVRSGILVPKRNDKDWRALQQRLCAFPEERKRRLQKASGWMAFWTAVLSPLIVTIGLADVWKHLPSGSKPGAAAAAARVAGAAAATAAEAAVVLPASATGAGKALSAAVVAALATGLAGATAAAAAAAAATAATAAAPAVVSWLSSSVPVYCLAGAAMLLLLCATSAITAVQQFADALADDDTAFAQLSAELRGQTQLVPFPVDIDAELQRRLDAVAAVSDARGRRQRRRLTRALRAQDQANAARGALVLAMNAPPANALAAAVAAEVAAAQVNLNLATAAQSAPWPRLAGVSTAVSTTVCGFWTFISQASADRGRAAMAAIVCFWPLLSRHASPAALEAATKQLAAAQALAALLVKHDDAAAAAAQAAAAQAAAAQLAAGGGDGATAVAAAAPAVLSKNQKRRARHKAVDTITTAAAGAAPAAGGSDSSETDG